MLKTELIKPVITDYRPDDPRKLCSFSVPSEVLGRLSVNVSGDPAGTGYRFITKISNRLGKVLGFEEFAMYKGSDNSSGLLITVEPEYRRRSYRFGELLRLASIIEILENKIRQFHITSKNTAVYFHSKYKFLPSIKYFYERDRALEAVIRNKAKGFERFYRKASEILERAKILTDAENQRQSCIDTNSLIGAYIKTVLETSPAEYKKHPFNFGMDMVLTSDSIKNNSGYFNKLFRNHGIDYTI